MSNLDDNREYVLLGEDPTNTVVPLKVSAIGELIIEFVIGTSTGSSKNVATDNNRTPSSSAENPSNLITSLLTDSNGYLIIDTTGLVVS
jgi:hypothetical protein